MDGPLEAVPPSRRAFLAALAQASAEPLERSLTEVAALVRKRRISPVELTKAALARIAQRNPALNAFITVSMESALAEARTLEAEQAKGRFPC